MDSDKLRMAIAAMASRDTKVSDVSACLPDEVMARFFDDAAGDK